MTIGCTCSSRFDANRGTIDIDTTGCPVHGQLLLSGIGTLVVTRTG